MSLREFEFHGFTGKRRVLHSVGVTISTAAASRKPGMYPSFLIFFGFGPKVSLPSPRDPFSRFSSPNMVRAQRSAGIRTAQSSGRSLAFRFFPLAPFGFVRSQETAGSATISLRNLARYICFAGPRELHGSTAFLSSKSFVQLHSAMSSKKNVQIFLKT